MTSTRLAYSGFSENKGLGWVLSLVGSWNLVLVIVIQGFSYFCVFKYTRTVKQNVGSEAENGERDRGETLMVSAQHFAWLCFLCLANIKGLSPPPPYPTTLKHTTGVTDNKKYSSHDSHRLSPERGTFFRLQVYQRIKISLIKVSERVGKSLTSVCKKTKKTNRRILWLCKSQENVLVLWFKGGTKQLGFWRGQH